MKINKFIASELSNTDYKIIEGTKHHKIYVQGVFCGILPKGGGREMGREVLNIRSQIRRTVRGLKTRQG